MGFVNIKNLISGEKMKGRYDFVFIEFRCIWSFFPPKVGFLNFIGVFFVLNNDALTNNDEEFFDLPQPMVKIYVFFSIFLYVPETKKKKKLLVIVRTIIFIHFIDSNKIIF